jgi:hypothetical protein
MEIKLNGMAHFVWEFCNKNFFFTFASDVFCDIHIGCWLGDGDTRQVCSFIAFVEE